MHWHLHCFIRNLLMFGEFLGMLLSIFGGIIGFAFLVIFSCEENKHRRHCRIALGVFLTLVAVAGIIYAGVAC